MSFHATGSEFRVEHNHVLKGRLNKTNGEGHGAEINLNDFLGNKDGELYFPLTTLVTGYG